MSPRWKVGEHEFRRKNTYLPCIISARVEEMDDEEYARVMREAYWADNITNAEWPLVLKHDGVKAYVRSKFKKKAAGWLVALARVAYLNEDLFAEIAVKAEEMYRGQIEQPSFMLQTFRNLAEVVRDREKGEVAHSQVWAEEPEERRGTEGEKGPGRDEGPPQQRR
jgi:hypothetical protein